MPLDLDLTTKTVLAFQGKHIRHMEGTDGGLKIPGIRLYDENWDSIWKTDGSAVQRPSGETFAQTSRAWHEEGRLVWFSINEPSGKSAAVAAGTYDTAITNMVDRIYDYFETGPNPTGCWQQVVWTYQHEPEQTVAADFIAAWRRIWGILETRRGSAKKRIWFVPVLGGNPPRKGGAWSTHWPGAGPSGNQYCHASGWDPYYPIVNNQYPSDPTDPPWFNNKFVDAPAGDNGNRWGGWLTWMTNNCPADFPMFMGEFGISHEDSFDITKCDVTTKGIPARFFWYNDAGTAQHGTRDMVSYTQSSSLRQAGGASRLKVASYFMYDPTPIRFNIRKTVDPGGFDGWQKALVALDPTADALGPPTSLAAGAPTTSSVTLTWTNDPAANGVQIKVYSGDDTSGTLLTTVTKAKGVTSHTTSGVPAGSHRTYQAFSVGADGTTLSSGSNTVTVIYTTSSDVTAPSVPTGLAVTATTSSTITWSWNVSTDSGTGATGVAGYRHYLDGSSTAVLSAANPATTVTLGGFAAGSSHYIRVTSVDNAGNESTQCASVTGTTTSTPVDTTPPPVPTGLSRTSSTDVSITAGWSASSGAYAYRVLANGVRVGDTTSTSLTLSKVAGAWLTPGTSYDVTVQAYDLAGNFSAPTAKVTMSTSAPTSTSKPVVKASITPNPGLVNSTYFVLDLSQSYSPQGTGPLNFTVDWDDFTAPIGPTTQTVFIRRFPSDQWGIHRIKIAATDAGSRSSQPVVVLVQVNPDSTLPSGLDMLQPHDTLDSDSLNLALVSQMDAKFVDVQQQVNTVNNSWGREVLLGTPSVGNNVLPPGVSVDTDISIRRIRLRCAGTVTGAGLQVRVNAIRNGVSTAIGTVTVPAGATLAEGTFNSPVSANDILTYDLVALNGATDIAVLVAAS